MPRERGYVLFGMSCKAKRAGNGDSLVKRFNAADRPKRPLPEGFGLNSLIKEGPACALVLLPLGHLSIAAANPALMQGPKKTEKLTPNASHVALISTSRGT